METRWQVVRQIDHFSRMLPMKSARPRPIKARTAVTVAGPFLTKADAELWVSGRPNPLHLEVRELVLPSVGRGMVAGGSCVGNLHSGPGCGCEV